MYSWLTPISILEMVREVIGDITLDPASSEEANKRVGAEVFYDEKKNGLECHWYGNVFCNPPGGKIGNKSVTALFWTKLMNEVNKGMINHAIFLCFSAEALQNTQGKGVKSVGEFTICIPAKRIRFEHPMGITATAPSHSNIIAYVPSVIDETEKFKSVFSKLGCVR